MSLAISSALPIIAPWEWAPGGAWGCLAGGGSGRAGGARKGGGEAWAPLTDLALTLALMEAVRAELGDGWIFSPSWDGAELAFMAREKADRHSVRIGLLEPRDYHKPLRALAQDIATFVKAQRAGGGTWRKG